MEISFTAEEHLNTYQAFDLEMSGLGFFPCVTNPREKRKFSPHLTLARLKSPKNMDRLLKTIEYEETLIKDLGGFKVLTINLMRSDLTPSGPIYSSIFKVDLAQ